MPLWRLTPINLSDPKWKSYKPDPMIVRAENEGEARQLAMYITLEFSPAIPGRKLTFHNPWQDSSRTKCEEITAEVAGHSSDGPSAVLNRDYYR